MNTQQQCTLTKSTTRRFVTRLALASLCTTNLVSAKTLSDEAYHVATAVGYAAAGYGSMGIAKYFGKHAAEEVHIPKGTAHRVAALDFKFIMFAAIKSAFAKGTTAIPGVHLQLAQLSDSAAAGASAAIPVPSLQKTLFDAGSKYWTFEEFVRYIGEGLEEFDHQYGNHTHTKSSHAQNLGYLAALQATADTIYNEVLTLVGAPAEAIVLATHIFAAWRISMFSRDLGGAFRTKLAGMPAMGFINAEPFNRVIETTMGYSLACYLNPFIIHYVHTAATIVGLPTITNQKMLSSAYHAGNKGPFAWESAQKLWEAVVAFTPQATVLFVHSMVALWHRMNIDASPEEHVKLA